MHLFDWSIYTYFVTYIFADASDEDIGSILEEMSKIAGGLSPNSVPDHTKSSYASKTLTEEEKSVEELLEEAEKLIRKNDSVLLKNTKSETLVPEDDQDDSLSRVRQLEADIFQLIEQEVHKESEKIRNSPKNEKQREDSPGFEIVYEKLKSPKTLERQKRKFDDQKVEISSSSDLDDPIERHSKSEELKNARKIEMEKENLQKEITDVEKDFFENLLKRSKEKTEGRLSGSSSFGQEDFSHFLKLLQGQTDKKELESKEPNAKYDLFLNGNTLLTAEKQLINDKTPEFPEKEFSEILEKELMNINIAHIEHEINESDSSKSEEEQHADTPSSSPMGITFPKKFNDKSSKKSSKKFEVKNVTEGNKKVVNPDCELYTVGLTPRLELFADAIPKLIAEKMNEDLAKENAKKKESLRKELKCSEIKTDLGIEDSVKVLKSFKINQQVSDYGISKASTDLSKIDRIITLDNKQEKKETKSRNSDDQICQSSLRSSLENIRVNKAFEISKKPISSISTKPPPVPKSKIQSGAISKIVSRPNIPVKSIKIGSTSNLPTASKGSQVKSADSYRRNAMAGGDSRQNPMKRDWEVLYREEKHRNTLLKQQLEAEAKLYKNEIEDIRRSFEGELFALNKRNIILKARINELSLNEKRPEVQGSKNDAKFTFLEHELQRQENLIQAYETENKKLIHGMKRTQEEMRNLQCKQKSTALETNNTQPSVDEIKDLQEKTLKLNFEIIELREKNADYLMKNDDLSQQNSLLTDELKMFKEQLRAKSDFITDRLQVMTTAELELKKQVEDLSIKLSSKSERLRITKQELDKLQQGILPLEKELLELRAKETHLQEKLHISKSHVEREKQLTQRLKDQVIVDNKKVMDLNRQVREMERILKRKNPDSVSALILTANSEQEKIGCEKMKLLEERIACLENEIKTKEDLAQQNLIDLQKKFSDMREKYIAQITELEAKLSETTAKERKLYNNTCTQTTFKYNENKAVETNKREDKASVMDKDDKKDQKVMKVGPKSQNLKEDTHLIATIRGLKLEIANKDKTITKVTKEYQEIQKTNKRLQKEREKLLNDRRSFRSMDFDKVFSRMKSVEGNDPNSNVYQNGHVPDSQGMSVSTSKLYDPMQYTEDSKDESIKRLTNENDILKEDLSKINKDFLTLKSKRLHDLNLLQEEHEREIANLVKEYNVKCGDSKAVKLQVCNATFYLLYHAKAESTFFYYHI